MSLAVKGGSGNETIAVYPGGTNQIVVKILGPTPYQGTFSTTQLAHLVFYGGSGNNSLWIEPGVKIPAVLIGGSGNNTFIGGQGPAIMVGGSGHNIERAGTGPTVMIAGSGVSSLYGNTGYDLLIGGATNFDTNTTGLDSILAEWGDISAGFHSRVKLLEGLPNPKTGLPKGGLNGTDFLRLHHGPGRLRSGYAQRRLERQLVPRFSSPADRRLPVQRRVHQGRCDIRRVIADADRTRHAPRDAHPLVLVTLRVTHVLTRSVRSTSP